MTLQLYTTKLKTVRQAESKVTTRSRPKKISISGHPSTPQVLITPLQSPVRYYRSEGKLYTQICAHHDSEVLAKGPEHSESLY